MHCKNYSVDDLMSMDFNKDACGSYYADRASANGYLSNGWMLSPVQVLFYIKQTMLEQDATFRYQLLELHRVYFTQKDIMAEYRRNQLHEHYRLLDKQIQNPIRSEISIDDNSQMMLNVPRFPFSSPSITVNIPRIPFSGPAVPHPDIIQRGSCHIEAKNLQTCQKLSQDKGKKMMLDLSLPASHYLDDEREIVEMETVSDVCAAANYPAYRVSKDLLPANKDKLLDHSGEVNRVCSGESSSSKFAGLFDLNEPFQSDDEDIPNGSFHDSFSNTSTRSDLKANEKQETQENQVDLQTSNDDSGKTKSAWDSLVHGDASNKLPILSRSSHVPDLPMPFLFDPSERSSYGKENQTAVASDEKHHVVPYDPNLKSSSASRMRKYVSNVKRIPIAIQALPCFTSLALKKSSKSVVGSSTTKTNVHKTLKCKSSLKESLGKADQMVLTSRECKTSSRFINPINLETPISLENKESSRPRRGSTDKEHEKSENGDSMEQAKLAAEAIISISLNEVQRCQKNAICDSSVAICADSLYLFASVASSMACGSENKLRHNNGDEHLDYFEMMTLSIPETKFKECRFNKNNKKEDNDHKCLAHKPPRKGRASKGKQLKNFQKEILPSIASLSRQEVAEDFQIIEKLMDGAGSSKKAGSAKVGRRKSRVSGLNTNEINLCNELKWLEESCEMGISKNSLAGWGKVTRGRRGQRFPATNLPLIATNV